MLDFDHFVTEYKKLSGSLGVPFDLDRAEIHYEDLEDFSDSMLSECFKEARGSFKKMPLPADLKEIRSIISQQHFERQPRLSAAPEVYGPMPDHIRKYMENLSKFPTGKPEPRTQRRILTLEEIKRLESELSCSESEDF